MPLQTEYNKDTIKESILNKLLRYYGCTIEDATPKQVYAAVASTVRDQIMLKWRFEKEARRSEKAKRLYYLSIEFLTGRWLHNNLLNLCSTKEYEQAFEELGLTLRGVLHEEPEPALGNGGLGRLAACFLDSLATLNLPAMGCTIRYEYGLFRQKIVGGFQVGRSLGFPTINTQTEPGALLPRKGVYVTAVALEGHVFRGVTNVGTRPTFSDAGILSVESHLLNFSGDVYGEQARVSFLKYLRPEQSFSSGEALREQIARDVSQALHWKDGGKIFRP